MQSPALKPPSAPTAPAPTGGAQAVSRALSLLSLVGRGGSTGLGLAQLAQMADVTRPTARRLLLALCSARMIEQDPRTRRYYLGPEAYFLGSFAASRHGILQHARESMLRLAAETGDTVLLTIPQDDHSLCLERIEGSFPIRTHALMRGDRKPMGVGVGALAILAALPPSEADSLLQRGAGLNADLMRDLQHDAVAARKNGYAFNPGRIVPGSWGLGVVILWPDGRPAAALSIAAIADRMSKSRRPGLIAALQREARLIETYLSSLGPAPAPIA